MTRTDRRRFPAITALALTGAVLGLLFSPLQAQAGSAPTKPMRLSATASYDEVVLTWGDPSDDTITGYVILRRNRDTDVEGHFDELEANTGTAATTYTDGTVEAETRYTYRIKAINEYGVSERSRWVHIDTPSAPVPDKPEGLSAVALPDEVVLTWDDPDDDSITGYVILRRDRDTDVKGHFDELVANTGSAATTYTDDTVEAETRYTYRIKAINEYGESERSRWVPHRHPRRAAGDLRRRRRPGRAGRGGRSRRRARPRHARRPPARGTTSPSPTAKTFPEAPPTTGEVDVGGSVTGTSPNSGGSKTGPR